MGPLYPWELMKTRHIRLVLVTEGKIIADIESLGKSGSVSRIQGKGDFFFFSEAVIERVWIFLFVCLRLID